jgi:cbb3-type cytochrome oxidase subunit 1
MDWFVKAFLKASITWLAIGVTLGVGMAVHPQLIIYRPAHVHMNLLGFVTMMIYGVAYHVIPRFTGHPLHKRSVAAAQWWLANAGLALMVVGFCLAPNGVRAAPFVLGTGGVLSAIAAYCFVYNIWRTIDGARSERKLPLPGRISRRKKAAVADPA